MPELNVEFQPQSQIEFPYVPNKHLIGSVKITNNNNFSIVYKFKASTVNRFVIRPNQGCLQPGQSLDVQIVFHKDAITDYQHQKLQVVYGKSYQDASKLFTLHINNFAKNQNLNLTMMVEDKQRRVVQIGQQQKKLQSEIKEYSQMPIFSVSQGSSKPKSVIKFKTILMVLIIGFIIGFFSPVRMFRKGGLLSFIAEADKEAILKVQQQN